MIPDYSKGKIYKIWDNGFNKCYIGSTIEELSQRMARHRMNYKYYLRGTFHYLYSFKLFDEFGIDNCKIIWEEDYPCKSKKELVAREAEHIRKTDCVNKRVDGRSKKQYKEDNKEKMSKIKSEYREKHKEETQEYMKQYYFNNKQELDKRHKLNSKIKITCECGLVVSKGGLCNHKKTQKHKHYLQSLNQNNPQE